MGTGQVATLGAVALGLGLALGLVLTGTGPGASGIVGGEYWILVLVAASMTLGWLAARLGSRGAALLLSPLAVAVMIAVVLGVKYMRLPAAPLVGDGFQILFAIYAGCGVLGALLGRFRGMRAKTPAAAARTGLLLSLAIVVASVVPYALAALSD